jgi:hypothetical protein
MLIYADVQRIDVRKAFSGELVFASNVSTQRKQELTACIQLA